MQKVTPLFKQSKKAQKRFHEKQRGSWGELCPVTRIVPSKRLYDRRRLKKDARAELFL